MKKCILLVSISLLISCKATTDFEIKDQNGTTVMTVKTDGSVISNNKTLGKISKEGTFTDNDGKVTAKMTKNDILIDAKEEPLIKIDSNGKMDNGSGIFIEWSKKGMLMKANQSTGFTITPVDKKSFKKASILLFLYLNINDTNIQEVED